MRYVQRVLVKCFLLCLTSAAYLFETERHAFSMSYLLQTNGQWMSCILKT